MLVRSTPPQSSPIRRKKRPMAASASAPEMRYAYVVASCFESSTRWNAVHGLGPLAVQVMAGVHAKPPGSITKGLPTTTTTRSRERSMPLLPGPSVKVPLKSVGSPASAPASGRASICALMAANATGVARASTGSSGPSPPSPSLESAPVPAPAPVPASAPAAAPAPGTNDAGACDLLLHAVPRAPRSPLKATANASRYFLMWRESKRQRDLLTKKRAPRHRGTRIPVARPPWV